MKRLVLTRLSDNGHQTLGSMTLFSNTEDTLSVATLEPSWKQNACDISCIPPGRYKIIPRETDHYGKHFEILSVPGRDKVLIHIGNYRKDTTGCILVGTRYAKDMNADGEKDLFDSKTALGWLLACLEGIPFTLLDIVDVG